MGCSFCEEYDFIKSLYKKFDEECPPLKRRHRHFKACIFEYRTQNRKRIGSTTHCTHPLNFCPECGKALKRRRKINVRQTEGM